MSGPENVGGWPKELTPELRSLLGFLCFQFIHPAAAFRDAGFDIATKAEDEQAFFLHRWIGFWFEHGDKWRDAAEADLKDIQALLAARGDKL